MSLPVSLFRTALIISMGKRRLESFLGVIFIFAMVAHLSIASCATERKFGFLLQVLDAGPLCGSILGAGTTGGAGGATLGGFVWGATLGGVSGKSRLGPACSKLSSGVSIGMGVTEVGKFVLKKIVLGVFVRQFLGVLLRWYFTLGGSCCV